jgi:hypothetical protein
METDPKSFTSATWHHPEWSNHPYFAAATVNAERYFKNNSGSYDNTSYQERIYLVNFKDSLYIEVLRPDTIAYNVKATSGFYWPWLWVEVGAGFAEDQNWLKGN